MLVNVERWWHGGTGGRATLPGPAPTHGRSGGRHGTPWACRAFAIALTTLTGAVLLVPTPARGLGLELMPAGGRPAGRAGAVVAGGDSPWALHHNPALLARLPGNQLVGAAHLHFSERCMSRVEVFETPEGRQAADEPMQQVCAGGLAAVPQLAGSFQLAEGLTLGVGVYVPPADLRNMTYGDPDTLDVEVNGMRIDTPTRYLLVDADLLQAFPTVALAYEPHPAFRFGAAFGWGLTRIGFTNAAFARMEVGSSDVTTDARVHAEATDYFVPRVTLGLHSRPAADVPFEMGLAYMWQDDIRTRSAHIDVNSVRAPLGIEAQGSVDGVGIHVPLPSQLTFGMRYFSPLAQPVDTVGDRLSTERFDVELNVAVLFGERVSAFTADLPEGASISAFDGELEVDLPERFDLAHRWKTQVAIRLGGDINPVPGVFGLRWGFTFESHGVHHGYEQIDFTPFRRIGLHTGATVRLHRALDLSVSYAHMFQPTVTVGAEDASLRRAVGGDATAEDEILINAGAISSTYHALMIELGARF
jgi:hypothetical protein